MKEGRRSPNSLGEKEGRGKILWYHQSSLLDGLGLKGGRVERVEK